MRLTLLHRANSTTIIGMLVAIAVFLIVSKWRPGPQARLSHEFRVFIAGFLVWTLSSCTQISWA